MIPLNGKVVIITGASSGFGEDSARLFSAEGAKVVLAARRVERINALAQNILAAGGDALVAPMDVTNLAEIASMVEATIEKYGQIDILFNNAGLGRLDWFERLEPEQDIQTQVNVNLIGLMEVTRAVLPHMLAQRSGHIINMSSVAGWIAPPMYSIYAASKFGVRGFTDALRREVGSRGVTVSGIYPGPSHTEFGKHAGKSMRKSGIKSPAWTHIPSEYVAQRVVGLAKHPRRTVIIPWWFRPIFWADSNFPGVVDWVIDRFFVRKYQK